MSTYRHYTFESGAFGLLDLLVEIETTQETGFNPRDFIVGADKYDTVTDNGNVEITGDSSLPESFVSQ